MKISLVIPCYNEEANIEPAWEKISAMFSQYLESYTYEIIFVNDGSRDHTVEKLTALAECHEPVKYISFSRNFGKEAAMLAGLTYADGDSVIIMDGDLQHPPELIPQMVEKWREGYDQVIARRTRTGDSLPRSLVSRLYYKLVNHFVDVKLRDGVGDFRLLSRKALNALLRLQETNRFSKGLFAWIGYKQTMIEYENVTREAGESKWSIKSLIQYAIDGIVSFNNRPLRGIIYLGFFILLVSLVYIIYSCINIIFHGIDMPGYFTTITAILLLGGIQLISVGVIGEYIGRIYYEVKRRPPFLVDKTNMVDRKNHRD